MANWNLVSTDGRGYVVRIGDSPVVLGRQKGCTLALNDDAASRQHCVIEPDGLGGLRVRDLGSRNGTRHNSAKLVGQDAALNEGDTIRVGTHTFVVEAEAAPGESTPSRSSRSGGAASGGSGAGGGAARDDATDGGASGIGGPWAQQLRDVLLNLAPRGEGEEALTMLDASGEPTGALGGATPGPQCMALLLLLASKSRATDVHFEPKVTGFHVRVRVDGQMVTIGEVPAKVGTLVLGLVKTACLMRLEAQDAVQDGRFAVRFKNRRVDYRVSITPSVHGQKLVLRVLDSAIAPRSLLDLGLPPYVYERLRKVCAQDQGFILVCGPTGSGKTTTLYNALREIDRETTNVVTIEDPVEYQLENTTQIPIDEAKGNTFGALLRSVLRQDPDVILVGEIRDEETARTAMQAAMTGHLVFSTVHSKDSISAVFRLLDLKVEPHLVASSLDLVLAQRLVRVLCESCKRGVRITPGQATRLGKFLEGKSETFAPVGCTNCLKTGYRGRRAIYEMLDFNDELRDVVLRDPTITSMKRVIEKGLFTTLLQSGWIMASRGATDLEEIERVAGTAG
jgi:general secretion pathway protein E